MAIQIRGRTIDTVAIIDDVLASRQGYGYTVQNANLTPLPQDGPLGNSVENYLASPSALAVDAGLCDFKLSSTTYANFSGAELASQWYRSNIPAILCTRYEKTSFPEIAPYRRWIPSLLTPNELDPDALINGIDECIYELQGNFRTTRRPWRAQVHFMGPDEPHIETYFAEIPAWELDDIIKVRLKDLPSHIRTLVTPDFRCYAQVNLGAEKFEDLYWCDWEMP